MIATLIATRITIACATSLLTCLSNRYSAMAVNRKNVACTRSATNPSRNSVADLRMFSAVADASPCWTMLERTTSSANPPSTATTRYSDPAILASRFSSLISTSCLTP